MNAFSILFYPYFLQDFIQSIWLWYQSCEKELTATTVG